MPKVHLCPTCQIKIDSRGFQKHLLTCQPIDDYPSFAPPSPGRMNLGGFLSSLVNPTNFCALFVQLLLLGFALYMCYIVIYPFYRFWSGLFSAVNFVTGFTGEMFGSVQPTNNTHVLYETIRTAKTNYDKFKDSVGF